MVSIRKPPHLIIIIFKFIILDAPLAPAPKAQVIVLHFFNGIYEAATALIIVKFITMIIYFKFIIIMYLKIMSAANRDILMTM